MQEPEQEKCGTTHYAGCACHEQGWEETEKEKTVAELLVMCRQAVGNTFEGYKGGLYTMRLSTPLWVANYGDSHDTAIVGVVDAGWQVVIETAFQA